MYNGIGLATPRGSGTNGYVQRNLALSYKTKEKGNFKAPNEIATPSLKKPNTDIIEHDRKRKIEVKCLEFQSMLEDQGCTEEEIDKRVQTYRESLLGERAKEPRDRHGRIIVKETHEIAEAQLRKNEKLREAFGISEYFVEGSSFDPERHTKEAAAKAALEETQKYALIPSPPSSEDESTPAEKPAESSKSKKKKKASASSPDPSTTNVKKKKKKKHKRKSESQSDEEKVSSRHKSKAEKDLKKKRHVSASPSKTNKHRKRNDESSEVELRKTKKKKFEKLTEERSHKSRISRSPSPYRSDVESDDYESIKKKKRLDSSKTAEKKKRCSSPWSKARVQEADSSSAAEYDRKKKRSLPRSKARKHDREDSPPTSEYDCKKKYPSSGRSRKRDKSRSPTPNSSIERSPEVDCRDEGKRYSRNRSKEKQRKRVKEAAPRKHHHSFKRKSSPVDSDEDDFREPKISDKISKMGGGKGERSRSKKSSPDRRQKRCSSSVERRRGGEYKSESSASKRKRRDSSSEKESTGKRSRRDDSREKSTRKCVMSGDKYSKSFYNKKTRLTVSDSESDDRSSLSPDRRKVKSKPDHKFNKIDADATYSSSAAAKHKNRVPNRRNSDSEQSAEESKLSRENRRPPFEKARIESSKTFKNYVTADKSKSVRNDGEKNRAEGAKPSPLVESQLEVASKMSTPSKIIDNKHGKPIIDAQRNGVEAAPAVENGMNVDGSVTNRDSSTSSSLSYSPMEKYPHRYKDILADVSKKGQKSDLSLRRSEIKDKSSPIKGDDRGKRENEVKPPDAKEKLQSVVATKNAAPPVSESKSENLFCVSEVPLPPVDGSSSTTKLPAIKDGTDVAAELPKKVAKLIDSTSALVKSIPPALSQKPNTLASAISDVIAKSMQKRDASSSSESLRKRKSRSSSKSSSSSDSTVSSRKCSGSDSSSSSSLSSRGSTRRHRSRKKSSSSDHSSSSSSSDSSRSRSRGRSVTKSRRKKKKRGASSASHSDSHSYSSSYSSSRSRSISIPRRKGSPSFLERRRITSRKRRRRSRSSSSRSSSSL